MKLLHTLVGGFALVILSSGTASGQCTTETEQGRRLVLEFATQNGAGSRPTGVPVVTASQVRVLTNTADAGKCQQLYNAYMGQRHDPSTPPTDRHWTFYQVGSLYYVVVTRVSPPAQSNPDGTIRLRLGWTPILVFNQNFQHIVTVGR